MSYCALSPSNNSILEGVLGIATLLIFLPHVEFQSVSALVLEAQTLPTEEPSLVLGEHSSSGSHIGRGS